MTETFDGPYMLRTGETGLKDWDHILHICLGKYLLAVVCWLNQPNQYIGISQYPRSTNYRQSIAGGAKVKTFVTMQTHRQTHTPTLPATHTHMTWKHLSAIGSHIWGAYQHTKARDWNQKCWRICKTHVVKIKRSVHIPNNQKLFHVVRQSRKVDRGPEPASWPTLDSPNCWTIN